MADFVVGKCAVSFCSTLLDEIKNEFLRLILWFPLWHAPLSVSRRPEVRRSRLPRTFIRYLFLPSTRLEFGTVRSECSEFSKNLLSIQFLFHQSIHQSINDEDPVPLRDVLFIVALDTVASCHVLLRARVDGHVRKDRRRLS